MKRLHAYIIRAFAQSLFVIFLLSMFVFVLSRSAGDPVAGYVDPYVPLYQIEQIRIKYHLDEPLYIQYFYWLQSVFQGDFGKSRIYMYRPVFEAIIRFVPITIELAIYTLAIMIPISMWLATKSVAYKDKWPDHVTRLLAIAGRSMPVFFFGIIILMAFYPYKLTIVSPNFNFEPITGMPTFDALMRGDLRGLVTAFQYLLGPLVVQVFVNLALTMRILRSSMLEELFQDYVTMGISKGLSRDYILKKYVRRNAMIPFITLIGIQFAYLVNGSVISETIFNRKGLGFLAARAAMQLDHPTILGLALILGATMVFTNLIVDIAYVYLDPRIMKR
jgi:peptide/nickel transport system permease protein